MQDTVKKESWFSEKRRQFKDWRERTRIKIDHWSRKKPFRRKLYLNRTLYLMMLPFMLGFALFTIVFPGQPKNTFVILPIFLFYFY